jgi:hypothetical protein
MTLIDRDNLQEQGQAPALSGAPRGPATPAAAPTVLKRKPVGAENIVELNDGGGGKKEVRNSWKGKCKENG